MVQEPEQQEQKQPGAPQAPAHGQEIEQLRVFMREYGQSLLIGLGLAVAVFLGLVAYRNYRESAGVRASQMLFAARTPEQLQQIVGQYGSTPVAPVALLALAEQYFDAGQYDLSQYTYQQFVQKYPKHPMVPASEIGKAQCLEAAGQLDQALETFDAFRRSHTNHFLGSVADLGRARCLTQMGRLDEARVAYEDFIAAHPKSGWDTVAETALLFVDKEIRARKKGLVEPSAASALGTNAPPIPFSFPSAAPTVPSPPASAAPAR